MTAFLLSSFGLTVVALLFMLPTLLRRNVSLPTLDYNQANVAVFKQQMQELEDDRDAGILEQDRYESAKRDLERSLALDLQSSVVTVPKSERWSTPLLLTLVPLLAITIYLQVGNYPAIDRPNASATAAQSDMPAMETLVERLAQKMLSNPNNLQGWLMLGRSALALGQEQRAVEAYAKAASLAPKEPEVLLAYADALAQVTQKFEGKPAELIAAALAINPEQPQGLWLMGWVEYQRDALDKALEYWTRLEAKIPSTSEEADSLRKLIAATRDKKP